jgi:hypothetical protein
MKERSIRCTDDEVLALLAGRKKHFRRPCQVQPAFIDGLWHALYPWGEGGHGIYETETEMREEYGRQMLRHCPFGVAGDQLWVRESWGIWSPLDGPTRLAYRADGKTPQWRDVTPPPMRPIVAGEASGRSWIPSLHMPRWASRITQRITDVRIERLHDITEAGAELEGFETDYPVYTARGFFKDTWEAIYGGIDKDTKEPRRTGWNQNPLVYIVATEIVPTT